jgi:hypothetical protein
VIWQVVRHVEEAIMEKFSITPGDLPRICLFADDKRGAVFFCITLEPRVG